MNRTMLCLLLCSPYYCWSASQASASTLACLYDTQVASPGCQPGTNRMPTPGSASSSIARVLNYEQGGVFNSVRAAGSATANLGTGEIRLLTDATANPYLNRAQVNAVGILEDTLYFDNANAFETQITIALDFDGVMRGEGYSARGQITLDFRVTHMETDDTFRDSRSDLLNPLRLTTPVSKDIAFLTTYVAVIPANSRGSFITRTEVRGSSAIDAGGLTANQQYVDGDFTQTAAYSLTYGPGVTFSSASGHFLTSPVPESNAGAMLVAGLATIAVLRLRTRRPAL